MNNKTEYANSTKMNFSPFLILEMYFVCFIIFFIKRTNRTTFSVTDRMYSSISLKLQKYFFTQFWTSLTLAASRLTRNSKKRKSLKFCQKMFCRSGICSRQRFIHFICHLQSSRCNNKMNKLKMFVHQTKIFWENLKFLTVVYAEGGGRNHHTGLGNFIMLWALLEAWQRWKHSQSFYIKLQIIQNALK